MREGRAGGGGGKPTQQTGGPNLLSIVKAPTFALKPLLPKGPKYLHR